MEDLNSEFNLNMTEVLPPVPPAMREVLLAEPGAGAGGGCGRQPSDIIGLPQEGRFWWHQRQQ